MNSKYKSLFKYKKIDSNTIDELVNSYIFAPTIKQLNDPYEKIIDIGLVDYELHFLSLFAQSDFGSIKKHINDLLEVKEHQGVFSLTSKWNTELLWTHYAASHEGICIEYDVEELVNSYEEKAKLIKVKYTNLVPIISVLKIYSSNDQDYLLKVINGVKSKSWKYENEYRLIFNDNGKHFYKNRIIKSITIGSNAKPAQISQVFEAIRSYNIDIYRAYIASKVFRINRMFLGKS